MTIRLQSLALTNYFIAIKNLSFLNYLAKFIKRITLILLGFLILSCIVIIKSKTAQNFWTDPLLLCYTIFVTCFELSRIIGAMFYQSVNNNLMQSKELLKTRQDNNYEPRVTFIIPCKDEEKVIAKTISKCYQVDYPANKIEVIVINDGSTDNTLKMMQTAKTQFKKLKIINWQKNKGKRQAMAAGIKKAKGEIIIQLDSDSYIKPECFNNFIQPFNNPAIGAVCAHTDPSNAEYSWLTKMQAAYYFISFRILKAAESTFFAVFCCSGCASAYRKSVIRPIIDDWLAESFLGKPVTWGDDRALTNWVLKRGYLTIYNNQVQAFTECPNTFKKFIKQQIRWKKGWLVNSLFASRFIYKKHPFVSLTYFFPLIFITLATPFMATRALIFNPIANGIMPFYYILGIFLISAMITLYYHGIAHNNKYWPYIFIWSGINMVFLSFILLYALATIQNRSWGTR